LGDCQYSAIKGDDGLYLGAVMISFPSDQILVPDEDTCIEARDLKSTVAKAHNAAARDAISHLEKHFNVEVAGYRHIDKVEAEQEMFVWQGINNETRMLAANVLKFWEDMVERLEQSIALHRNRCNRLACRPSVGNEMAFIYDLVGRLGLAASKCSQTFKVAAAKFSSLE
jgi:hypothetical protein